MYIHIGGDVSLQQKDITVVLNLETVLPSQKNVTDFINAEDDNNRLQYLTDDIPRSLVMTTDRTYVSPLSVNVLQKRLKGDTDPLDIGPDQ